MRNLTVFNFHFEVRCEGYNHAPASLRIAAEDEELAKAALKQHLTTAHPDMVELRFIGGPTLVTSDVLLAEVETDTSAEEGEDAILSLTPGTPTPVPAAGGDEPPATAE